MHQEDTMSTRVHNREIIKKGGSIHKESDDSMHQEDTMSTMVAVE
jgi:hypothetical protein